MELYVEVKDARKCISIGGSTAAGKKRMILVRLPPPGPRVGGNKNLTFN
jgi:hypothetical protein